MHGDSVIVDPAELIGLAEYLESITSMVYWDDKDGNTLYCVRMIMNCGECNMHMIGPDGVSETIDDAESAAREGLIRQWNTRFKN